MWSNRSLKASSFWWTLLSAAIAMQLKEERVFGFGWRDPGLEVGTGTTSSGGDRVQTDMPNRAFRIYLILSIFEIYLLIFVSALKSKRWKGLSLWLISYFGRTNWTKILYGSIGALVPSEFDISAFQKMNFTALLHSHLYPQKMKIDIAGFTLFPSGLNSRRSKTQGRGHADRSVLFFLHWRMSRNMRRAVM